MYWAEALAAQDKDAEVKSYLYSYCGTNEGRTLN
jgi:monomeric isocitrate dehydrogenase